MAMVAVSEHEKLEMRLKLRSLGCAYGIDAPSEPVDLEQTILECLPFYWRYNNFFFMCYSLLKHRLHSYVNVERLIALTKKSKLPDDELVLLLALSQRLAEHGDKRFGKVIDELKRSGLVMTDPPSGEQDAYLITQWGVEKSLEPYGVRVRAFYEELPKKLYVLDGIFENNEWLRIRSKVGANFKADIAYLKISGKAVSALEAAEVSGCRLTEAREHWKALENVFSIENLVA